MRAVVVMRLVSVAAIVSGGFLFAAAVFTFVSASRDGGRDFCSDGGVSGGCFLLCGGCFFSGGCFLLCGTVFFTCMVCRCSFFSLMASVFAFLLLDCVLCMTPSMVHMMVVPVMVVVVLVVVPVIVGGPVSMMVVREVLLVSGPPRRL